MNTPDSIPDARFFKHEAMNTTFTLRLRGMDRTTAEGMARECIDMLDSLESKLSRFIAGSDVARVNAMEAGETLYLNEDTHACLLLALDGWQRTGGLFDITLGSWIEHRKSGADGPDPVVAGRLTIHPDVPAVTCEEAGRVIDLGGIGKGFALDALRGMLVEWGAEEGLLAAGASSMLAFGKSAWPIELAGDRETVRIDLRESSLSASGTGIQGSHIVHPGGGGAMPVQPCSRLWVTAPTAAMAEIWSTALMLVPAGEIPGIAAGESGIRSVHADQGGVLRELGAKK